MTIVASGEISLGGNATATRSVACEIGRSGTAAICMDESAVRTLAARTTAASAICMDNFYGKANAPTAFGAFCYGGYYTGVTSHTSASYYLIVAPNASGCACCKWKTNSTLTNNSSNPVCNCNNGYWNTFTYLNNATHPAGNWAATRFINTFTDWYLPSFNELNLLYANKGSMPAGEGYISACVNNTYWSSTENFLNPGYSLYTVGVDFGNGSCGSNNEVNEFRVRAVRRECFSPAAPTALGQFVFGGYYTGTITSPANYYLIVAPNATGCSFCAWKVANSNTNNCSNASCNQNNGYWNTFTYLNNGLHPAGNWAATRNINGFSDWYLPARNELNVLYTNKGSMPAGQGYSSSSTCYWSSSENSNFGAYYLRMSSGSYSSEYKQTSCNLRAVRRVPF